MDDRPPAYEFGVRFFSKYLQINFETGLKYLRLGVLTPDAVIAGDERPLFATDLVSVTRHKAAITAYRARQRAAANNLRNLNYV